MLRSIKQLYGYELGASDGKIGHVKDFYFSDERWVVRYVVVDTGDWLPGRLVLVSPHAFGDFYQDGNWLLVHLTREQIEKSPSIDTRMPISRQHEEAYYRYYGWPAYWNGTETWGATGVPVALPPQHSLESKTHLPGQDPHLRSAKAIAGYEIETPEGTIGCVADLMIDDKNWAIRHLVVETGNWFFGKQIVISPKHIERISYEESKVFVNVSRESIVNAPEYHMPRAAYHDSQEFIY